MLINSHSFILFFLPLTIVLLALSSLISRSKNLRVILLVIISVLFYSLFDLNLSILVFFAIIINFFLAWLIKHSKYKSFSILTLGVILNLFLLGYFKYSNYFIDNINLFFNIDFVFKSVIMPLGLSFIVFQQISYLVDQYHNKVPTHSFIEYFLFIVFFPKIIAGPILRSSQFFYQIKRKRFLELSPLNLAVGSAFLGIGLFKKVVLGDRFGFYADRVFSTDIDLLSLGDLWLGMLCYSMQIYFDFSGYSDMAIGVSRMVGIRLPFNFNSPYKAVSIIDFWRRWHITLSSFLRDYLYIPLGGNRLGKKRQYLSILITMILGGLWHGAGNTFLLWGLFHGLLLIIANVWKSFNQPLPTWFSIILTFVVVSIGWVFFRATSIEYAFDFIIRLFNFGNELNSTIFSIENLYHWGSIFIVGFGIVFIMPNIQSVTLSIYRYKFIFALFLASLFLLSLLSMSKIQPFIYNAF